MRADLKNIAGVSNISTDTKTNVCKFAFVSGEADIDLELEELGEINDHMAGYSIISKR